MPAYNFQNVAGTNWLNIDTAGEVGIGDTTPDDLLNIYSAAGQAALAITSAGTDTDALIKYELTDGTALFTTGIDDSDGDKFKISGSALGTSDYLVISGGDIGIGVSDPDKRLEVFETVADSQFKLSYDATSYAQFQTSSAGDLTIDASGGDVNVLDENFWVCSGGACPSGTPTGNGNLIVERGIGVATSTPITGISVGADSAIVTTEKNVADAGTITIDWNQGNQQLIRLAASRTVNFSNVKVGQTLRLVVCRTAGSYTATWGSTIRWGGGAAPTQTTTSNKCDVFSFIGTLSDTGSAVIIFGSSSLNF
jgi:hypothetical protein